VALALLAACPGPTSAVRPPPRVSSQAVDPATPDPIAPPTDLSEKPATDLSEKPAEATDLSEKPAPRTPPTTPLELTFVGDIILGKYRLDAYAPLFTAPEDPFAAVAPLLKSDAAIANLETPLMHTRPERSPIYIGSRFGADKQAARALVPYFATLGVANNHALDLLTAGLEQTPEVLRELGIVPVGEARASGDPVQIATLERNGWRLALLAATTWINRSPETGDPKLAVFKTGDMPRRLLPAIRTARADHDLVIVLLHWGQEYSEHPDHAQRVAAKRLLAGGADLVDRPPPAHPPGPRAPRARPRRLLARQLPVRQHRRPLARERRPPRPLRPRPALPRTRQLPPRLARPGPRLHPRTRLHRPGHRDRQTHASPQQEAAHPPGPRRRRPRPHRLDLPRPT
jgi:hypothetical protein